MSLVLNSDDYGPQAGERHAFHFAPNSRALAGGAIAAVVLLAGLVGWAWWSGRIKNFDATYVGVLVGSLVVAFPFTVGRQWRSARIEAAALGRIEVDDEGVRWRRKGGELGFETSWKDVERATIDARNFTVVLFRRDAGPIVIGALSPHGVPSGYFVLERFGEMVELVGRQVPSSPHVGSRHAEAGRRTVLLGLAACLAAGVLYAVNMLAANVLHWQRFLIPVPAFVGAVGALAVLAGARVWTGTGPLVSALYGPGYRAVMVRFLVVASVANLVLLTVANTLAR